MTDGTQDTTSMDLQRRHRRIATRASALALVMLGMAFAAVPLYRMFCQVTGFAGTTQRVERPSTTTIDKQLVVRFDGNVSSDLDWSFEPVKRAMTLKIGENRLAIFRAKNVSAETLTGTASFNVTPDAAGVYFNKLECFCFTEQTLKPGQTVDMPVRFYIDPEFAKDRATRGISQVTLSYTFFPAKPAGPAKSGKPATAQRPQAKKGT